MATDKFIVPFEATHPGILIKDELTERKDLNQRELAKELGVLPSFLNEIIKGKRPITADLAIILEKVLGIPADYWMKFQSQYEIDKARIKERNIKKIKNIDLWNIIKGLVPIKYFKKHEYINDNLEDDIQKIKSIYAINSIDELVSVFAKSKQAFYRKSEKLKVDEKNMFAWSTLAEFEAKNQEVNTFNFDNINQLCLNLNKIFYDNSDTLERVKAILNQFGVKLVLIEKLEKTPIDGYAFWSEHNPAIALSLRHKRIDNFAFNVMHEIGHIDLHLRKDKNNKFIDLTNNQIIDKCEKEANSYAQEKLISINSWNNILENYNPFNDDKIIIISDKYRINPAILLGRISFEMDYYGMRTIIDKTMY